MHLTERRYPDTTVGDRPAQKLDRGLRKRAKVTSAMRDAGVAAFCDSDLELTPYWQIVENIYVAMSVANRRRPSA
jgi:hypothetical protein